MNTLITTPNTALIMGAGDSLGSALARRFASEGLNVCIARRNADNGNDLWRTFNRVQENVIRGGLHGWGRDANNRTRRVTTREVRGIDQDVRLNRAMWMLTEKMAELKGVGVAA